MTTERGIASGIKAIIRVMQTISVLKKWDKKYWRFYMLSSLTQGLDPSCDYLEHWISPLNSKYFLVSIDKMKNRTTKLA
jgi:hypothetical protein